MTDSDQGETLPHRPVLYHDIIHALRPMRGGIYVDCTLGAGGHAAGILEASSPTGKLLGLDLDPQALVLARERLASFGPRAIIRKASYVDLSQQLETLGWRAVDGVLLDLGVSSMQVDTPERGFSFLADSALDMRFDPTSPVTAADIVNSWTEAELSRLIFEYGEDRWARQIAKAIVQMRPIYSTATLADVIARATRKLYSANRKRAGIHPATRTFQALRIAVNRELENLEAVLPQAIEALAPGGRLAIIAFHSLEDRVVKQFLRRESRDCICPPRQPVCNCGHHASVLEITRQPLRPHEDELRDNPRARSARLRVAQKVEPSSVEPEIEE
jgi:16S rRNA (cytosine1402-N4)-methyltransferase